MNERSSGESSRDASESADSAGGIMRRQCAPPLEDGVERRLIAAAIFVRLRAYAPYSQFAVGAAILTEAGEIFGGGNVENASYGLTICAERVAATAAVVAGHHRFAALALAISGGGAPCGACRQFLAEFADDMPIVIVNPGDSQVVARTTLAELLPMRFQFDRTREGG